jgi:hypothetical protein
MGRLVVGMTLTGKTSPASRTGFCSFGYSTAESDGKTFDGEKNKWQPDLNAVKATIEYAIKTGRLQRQT